MERIDKVISNIMCLTRSQARRLIKTGAVYLNGEKHKLFDTKVDENSDITVNGEKITFQSKVYIMMNKREGVVCDAKSVDCYAPDDLPDSLMRKDIFCVGRLDKDTTGLLILTNDGDYAHKIISPKKHVDKCYKAQLAHPMSDADIKAIESGITLSDGTALMPAKVKCEDTTAFITVKEGKYHQIKRMAGAVENKVISLERISIGGLALDESLSLGDSRPMTEEEAFSVFE